MAEELFRAEYAALDAPTLLTTACKLRYEVGKGRDNVSLAQSRPALAWIGRGERVFVGLHDADAAQEQSTFALGLLSQPLSPPHTRRNTNSWSRSASCPTRTPRASR